MKPITKALTLLLVVGLLASCSASSALPEFEAAQTADDQVPDPSQLGDINPDSTRLIGEVDDYTLFLGRGEGTLCLIYVADDSIDLTACGEGNGVGSQLPNGVMIEAGDFSFPEDKIADGSRAELSESVSVITPR